MTIFTSKLGIDLGSNKTVIFKAGSGIVLEEPSVVAMDEARNVLAIGWAAKEMVGKTPDTVIAYKPILNGVISDYKVAEIMLSYFISKVLGRYAMFRPEVMVSVPSSINSTERRAVVDAIIKAGAKEVFVVREPVLAAIGSGVSIQEPEGRMVVNIGSGTTDVAVISLGGVVFSKSIKIAGDKMDQSIINMVKKNHNVVIGDKTAENIKKTIGSAVQHEQLDVVVVKGRDYVEGIPREIKINSDEVTECLFQDLKEVVRAIRDVFSETPPEIAADIYDTGILLTGGGAQLRDLSEYIFKELGVKTEVAENPGSVVALGAGIALAHVDLYKRSIISKKAE